MKILNRRAHYEYQLLEKFEAGIVLTGGETKSVKTGHMDLNDSFVKIINNEAFLVNAFIPPYPGADNRNYDPKRTRRLLLHKKQILALLSKTTQKRLTIVPVSCYTTRGLIKLELALARGKREYDKRAAIKKKDLERKIEEDLRGTLKN